MIFPPLNGPSRVCVSGQRAGPAPAPWAICLRHADYYGRSRADSDALQRSNGGGVPLKFKDTTHGANRATEEASGGWRPLTRGRGS